MQGLTLKDPDDVSAVDCGTLIIGKRISRFVYCCIRKPELWLGLSPSGGR